MPQPRSSPAFGRSFSAMVLSPIRWTVVKELAASQTSARYRSFLITLLR